VSYLDVAAFRVRTIMPNEQVDQLLTLSPGWLESQLEAISAWLDGRLSKRFTVPFKDPHIPKLVPHWLQVIVTSNAYASHGFPASDQQREAIDAAARRAESEVREAADGELGLFELAPSDQSIAPVMYGGTRVYSETSPYVGFDIQRSRGRREDSNGHGS
jgi:hypothetical protein